MPGQATLKGDARARHPEDRRLLETFMRQIVDGIAAAHGIEAKFTFATEFIEVINAAEPTEAVIRASQSLGLKAISDCSPMSFSEDFAHFSAAVPGCFLLLGNGESGPCGQPLHSAGYDFNDEILLIGTALWAALATDRLPQKLP